jgi:gliding motility-associated-like protein
MKVIFTFLLTLTCFLGWAQRPPQQWVFGQGQAIDFSGGGQQPRFFTVPWQANQGYNGNLGANFSNMHADSTGQVEIYFLNGAYYDGDHNLIWRDTNYHYYANLSDPKNNRVYEREYSWFLPSGHDQWFWHVYLNLTGDPANNWISRKYNILVRKITQKNGQWQIQKYLEYPTNNQSLDHYFRIYNARAFLDPGSQKPFMLLWTRVDTFIAGDRGPGQYADIVSLDSLNSGRINHNFSDEKFLEFCNRSYPSLLNPAYHYWVDLDIADLGQVRQSRSYLRNYVVSGAGQFIQGNKKWPLVVPGFTLDHIWYPVHGEISPSGRYFYAYMASPYNYVSAKPKLVRYDLLAPDSTAFMNSAHVIPLPPSIERDYGKEQIIDLQSAPDGNIYLLIAQYPFNQSNRLGRITDPDTADPTGIGINTQFRNYPPGKMHYFFPNRMPGVLPMGPFEQLSFCPSNVKLRFNYAASTDSLWWSFGDPSLGAANHDTATHPVIPYTEAGKYPVSVELWWQGRKWRTLRDTVRVRPVPSLDLPGDTSLCPGDTLLLDARQGIPAQYRWNDGSPDSTRVIRQEGYYRLAVSTTCDTVSDSLYIHYGKNIQPYSLQDTTLCQGDSLLLDPQQPGLNYRWQDGSRDSSYWVTQSGRYTLHLSTTCDTLQTSASINFEQCGCRFHVPNAFSPNGDGLNERFAIRYDCDSVAFQIQILNRWGEVIYVQNEDDPFWNGQVRGKPAPEGTYLYRLVFRGQGRDTFVEEERHGSLLLIR